MISAKQKLTESLKLINPLCVVATKGYIYLNKPASKSRKFVQAAFENQVLRTSAIKCRGKFKNFQFALAMRRQKKLPKTQQKPLYNTSDMASAYLGSLPKTMIFFLTGDTTYATNIILFTYNTLKREKQKTIFLPLITFIDHLFFVCLTHYPTLEKPGAQNITACENQQRDLSDH